MTSGSTFSVSNGTPGIEYKTASWPYLEAGKRNTMTGAVPNLFGMTSHLSGTWAWALFDASLSSPLECKISRIIASWAAFNTYDALPDSSASAAFVMSSFVGPRPPVATTTPCVLSSSSRDETIVSWSSPMDFIVVTFRPMALNSLAMAEELVSTI